jgi:hypothetical protein
MKVHLRATRLRMLILAPSLALLLLLAACSSASPAGPVADSAPDTGHTATAEEVLTHTPTAAATDTPTPADTSTPRAPTEPPAPTPTRPDPTPAGSDPTEAADAPEAEYQIVTLLPFDAIPSIDNPRFYGVDEADAEYGPGELVLGVEVDGEARAYSVGLLSRHEIVNDRLGGHPIAVTW